jgi:hypothetical protein
MVPLLAEYITQNSLRRSVWGLVSLRPHRVEVADVTHQIEGLFNAKNCGGFGPIWKERQNPHTVIVDGLAVDQGDAAKVSR